MSGYDSLYGETDPSRIATSARASAVLGILAMTLCMFGCCSSQLTTCTAAPVAIVAVFLARSATGTEDAEARAYANVGIAGGAISLVYFLIVVSIISLYLLLYVAMFGVAFIANL